MKKKVAILIFGLLCLSTGLTGCKDTEKENAIAEAAAAKTELTKVKADLTKITSERDNLKLELATVIEARDKLQATVGQTTNIKEQLAGLTEERDTAVAKATSAQTIADKLKGQLAEQIQKIAGLEGQNKQLQAMVDELKKKLGGGIEIPAAPKP